MKNSYTSSRKIPACGDKDDGRPNTHIFHFRQDMQQIYILHIFRDEYNLLLKVLNRLKPFISFKGIQLILITLTQLLQITSCCCRKE